MKKTIKVMGLLLATVTAVAFVGCGDNTGDNVGGDAGNNKTQPPVVTPVPGLTMEDLSNYSVKYTVEIVSTDTATGETVTTTTNNTEAGYSGMYFSSTDNGESYIATQASCFGIESTTDPRGWFNAHKTYLYNESAKEKVTNEGEETIAGHPTVHYHYKNGLFDIDFWVWEEKHVTLKYVNNRDQQSLTVTELAFGAVDSITEYQSRLVTPAPAEPTEAAE